MKKLVIFLFVICIGVYIHGQPWMQISKTKSAKEVNFYDIQDAFNEYWKDRKVEKGKGYSQFKRWENFMEPRVYPSGVLPSGIIWDEIQSKETKTKSTQATTANWVFLGPDDTPTLFTDFSKREGSGRLNAIAFHPTDSNIIWVGAPSGGLWKTTDGGNSWETTTDELAAIGISDIAVNPLNPDIIYIVTGDGDHWDTYSIGILKSTDGGDTWNPTIYSEEVTNYNSFRRILIHPVNPNIMIAAARGGILKTINGWTNYDTVQSGDFKDLEFDPSDPSVIYAASFDKGGNAKIYKSTDTASSFSESMAGISFDSNVDRIELAVTPANAAIVYAVCSDVNDAGFYSLYKSVNKADNWTEVYDNEGLNLLGWSMDGMDEGGQGWYDLTLAVSPVNANIVFVGGVNIWKSEDGGSSWELNTIWYHYTGTEYVHADHHALVFSPYNNILYSGNDGGIYRSRNMGQSWTDISDGIQILQTYRITNSVNYPDINIAGNQDCGTFIRNDSQWNRIVGGDGMECYLDYLNDDIIYASVQRGDLRKSTDGGYTFTSIIPNPDLTGSWITPYIVHPEMTSLLYAGYDDVYISLNGGVSWTEISQNLTGGGNLEALAVTPSNNNIIYAADGSNIWKTTNHGNSWTDISGGLPNLYISYIAISETDHNKLWVALSGYSGGNKVYYSSDGGQTWTNYSDGLPNLPVNCIIYQNSTNNALYIGTDIGVYYRDGTMASWIDFSDNLPNVIVSELEIQYSAGKLRAGTYGRGLWETDLYTQSSDAYADFTVENTLLCSNTATEFTYYGSAARDSMVWNFGSNATPATAKTTGPHSVSYSTNGMKTVTLSVYLDGVEYTETKTDIIEVTDEIDFFVSPDRASLCESSTAHLFASGNFDFVWSPSDGLVQTTGNHVIANPSQSTTYTVTATSGSCNAQKTVDVIVSSNDDICDAITLYEGLNGPFTNECATAETNEPVPPAGSSGCSSQDGWCAGETNIDNSLWYKFVAPDEAVISIETDGFDSQIAVYDAETCSHLLTYDYTLIAANDDFPGKTDYSGCIQELTTLIPGRTYWVQVDGSYGGVTGMFTIRINNYRLSPVRERYYNENISVNVYPNPNPGVFTVEYSLEELSDIVLKMYKIDGTMVYEKHLIPSQLNSIHNIELDNISDGIYILQFTHDGGDVYRKLLVK